MALTKPSMAVNIITSLGTTSQERGLTESQFKAKFDETPAAIKTYLNDVLTAELDSSLPSAQTIGALINGASAITTPADADLTDIVQSSVVKKITWGNIKATLKTYFDGLYPSVTTAAVTYYVRKDGSDANTGLADTAGGAFLTIGKAIGMIPQTVNHTMTINVGAGDYSAEGQLSIKGKMGSGSISLNGAATATTTHVINGIKILNCRLNFNITGFQANATGATGFNVEASSYITFDKCVCTSAGGAWCYGFLFIYGSFGAVLTCIASNRDSAIVSQNSSIIYSLDNTGTGNTLYTLKAVAAARIGKYGTQPTGTEIATSGGRIEA